MIHRLLRYGISLLFGIMGFVGVETILPILTSLWDEKFLTMGIFGVSMVVILWFSLGSIFAALIGYVVSDYILRLGLSIAKNLERVLSRVPSQNLMAGTVGLLLGLIIANLIGMAFDKVPIIGPYLPIVLSAVVGYSGMRLGSSKGPDLYKSLLAYRVGAFRKKENPSIEGERSSKVYKLLDTSVIIDGRIGDIVRTGFLEGPFAVPLFVLEELQKISDSSDTLKRNRGRRGLDLLQEMREDKTIPLEVIDTDYEDIHEVDSKLMRLSLEKGWKLITNDFNLNKVATLQGIGVLNLNDLANAIKPTMMAGEHIEVHIIKEGKEAHQGIAYLADGTMIVIENGSTHVDKIVEVTVTSVLQTSAGRMIFARIEQGETHD